MNNFEEKGNKTFQNSPDASKSDDQEVVLKYSQSQEENSNEGEIEPFQNPEDNQEDYITKNPSQFAYTPISQNQNQIKSQTKNANQSRGSSVKDDIEGRRDSEASHSRGYHKRRVSRSRSRDKYKPLDSGKNRKRSNSNMRKKSNFGSNTFCCSKCRTKKNGKTCVCVVPRSQRRVKLTSEGCRSCGCKGCTKEDHEYFAGISRRRRTHRKRSSNSSSSDQSLEQNIKNQNFNNFQNSALGTFIVNQMNIYPPLLGFGVPQRTSSYILGYSKTHSHSRQKKQRR